MQVEHTREYDRVCALPRRVLDVDIAREWGAYLTPRMALCDGLALRPWQAMALAECVGCGGGWLALPVGQGKTLISWLLPTAMQSRKTILIVPGSLVDKTRCDFAGYVGQWRAPEHPILIVTREKLSTVGGALDLAAMAPDLIIIDEADDLANAQSACSRRLDRYIRDAPSTRLVAMTGTPARKSIMGYWHLLAWALGDGAPIPLDHSEAKIWALAIDEYKAYTRPRPGVLGRSLAEAREWYRRRLVETPGVVVVDEDSCSTALSVRVYCASSDPAIDDAFERFAIEQESPGGIPVSDPLSRWLLDAQLGLGLYSVWDPPPPEDWRSARRAVARFVREKIEATTRSSRPLDTEAQVLSAYPTHPVVREWLHQKPLFAGKTKTVWLSSKTLDDCISWLRMSRSPSIVWCGGVEFGRKLAMSTGIEYYGQKGQTDTGRSLHTAQQGAHLIASWGANKKGFNLQPWARQLIVMPPQSSKWLEQLFGRSHRAGQTQDVHVDILATSGGTIDAFDAAIAEAGGVKATVSLTQKILRADITIEPTPNGMRWARRQ